tara:strand:+ start:122 stop:388 length:267 start_codon:yes stop_codon:yes gene_type:complete
LFLTDGALVTLNLEGVPFDCTAYTAALLELFADSFEGFGMLGNPGDDCDGLTPSALGFSSDAHHAVAGYKGSGIAAYAFDQLALALGT